MTVKTEAEEAEENKAIMSSPLMPISGGSDISIGSCFIMFYHVFQ